MWVIFKLQPPSFYSSKPRRTGLASPPLGGPRAILSAALPVGKRCPAPEGQAILKMHVWRGTMARETSA
jgi:hypothetical protein